MKNMKNMPKGLVIISILTILFHIYYHLRPLLWGGDLSSYSALFELSGWALVLWFNIIIEIIVIYAVTIGFYKAKNWARLYTIAYYSYSSFWNLYVLLIIRAWPYERFGWLVFYVIVLAYLMMSNVLKYFKVKKFFI